MTTPVMFYEKEICRAEWPTYRNRKHKIVEGLYDGKIRLQCSLCGRWIQ